MNQFRRYSKWLHRRNARIEGFTNYDDKYYLVAKIGFRNYNSRNGSCSVCGVFVVTKSNNKKLDEFITNLQRQANCRLSLLGMDSNNILLITIPEKNTGGDKGFYNFLKKL